jgi:hypothetical protein
MYGNHEKMAEMPLISSFTVTSNTGKSIYLVEWQFVDIQERVR